MRGEDGIKIIGFLLKNLMFLIYHLTLYKLIIKELNNFKT